jgi:hypothetical protein
MYSLVHCKAEMRVYAMHELEHAWSHDRFAAEDQSKYGGAMFGLVEAICGRSSNMKLRLNPYVMRSFRALVRASNELH